jgi:hypothetical protein
MEEEGQMKRIGGTILIGALVAIFLSLGCSTSPARRGTEPAGSPPIIKRSFASGKVASRDFWKIYLESYDPDGDMRHFVYVIDQVGYGRYSTSYARIKKEHGEKLRGYLRVFFDARRRRGFGVPEGTQLTLTLYIKDRGGNASEKVVFPLVFSQGTKQGPPPPPFDSGLLERVGTIKVMLNAPGGF